MSGEKESRKEVGRESRKKRKSAKGVFVCNTLFKFHFLSVH